MLAQGHAANRIRIQIRRAKLTDQTAESPGPNRRFEQPPAGEDHVVPHFDLPARAHGHCSDLVVIGAVADVADQDILVTAAERYAVLRRFSPRFLAAFDFRSNTHNDPVLAAVELLRAMEPSS